MWSAQVGVKESRWVKPVSRDCVKVDVEPGTSRGQAGVRFVQKPGLRMLGMTLRPGSRRRADTMLLGYRLHWRARVAQLGTRRRLNRARHREQVGEAVVHGGGEQHSQQGHGEHGSTKRARARAAEKQARMETHDQDARTPRGDEVEASSILPCPVSVRGLLN